jgi:putative endonuclease
MAGFGVFGIDSVSKVFVIQSEAKNLILNYMNHYYYVYILSNIHRQVLYIGVTNDIRRRISEHEEDSKKLKKTFAGKYNCVHLIYCESHLYVKDAIARETERKGWSREKKYNLVKTIHPELKFLNNEI